MDVSRKMSPDGGWGWVVTGATAFIYFVTFGYNTSQGILMVGLLREYFPNDRGLLTLIPLLANGTSRLLAPFMIYFCAKSSYRIIIFAGGFLITLGVALSFLIPSIYFLIGSLGITIGIGISAAIFPSGILTSLYFDKHLSLANGIYTAGASIGCVTVPMLVEYLLQIVGIRTTFVYLACMSLQVCVAAALCQPVEWHMKKLNTEDECPGKSGCVDVSRKDRPVTHTLFDFQASEGEIKQKLKEGKVVLTRFQYLQSSFRFRPDILTRCNKTNNNNSLILNPTCLQIPSNKIPYDVYNNIKNEYYSRQVSTLSNITCSENGFPDGVFDRRDSHRSSLSSRISGSLVNELRKASLPVCNPTEKIPRCPLAPDDCIPEEEETVENTIKTPEKSMFSYLKSSKFYLIAFACSGLFINLSIFPVIMPDYALDEVPETETLERAAFLISALSLADFLTRVTLGWVWDLSCINRMHWFLGANILGGICFILASFAPSYQYLLICGIFDGISTGISGVIVAVIFMQVTGPKSFGFAMTTSSLITGVIIISSGFVISALKEQTGSYKITLIAIGVYELVGAIVWIFNCLCSNVMKG